MELRRREFQMVLSSFRNDVYSEKQVLKFYRCVPKNDDAFLVGILVGIYPFKVNNRKTRRRCSICSKLKIKIPERRQWRRSGVFIDNFEQISHLVLVFLLLNLSR